MRSAGTLSSSLMSAAEACESVITRSALRAAAGTSDPLPQPHRQRVRGGPARVDEVVDRDDADRSGPTRGRAARAVQQLDPVPARQAWQPPLLGQHTARPAAAADVDRDHLDVAEVELAALAVDECDQLEPGVRREPGISSRA